MMKTYEVNSMPTEVTDSLEKSLNGKNDRAGDFNSVSESIIDISENFPHALQ